MGNLFYRIVKFGFNANTMRGFLGIFGSCLLMIGLALGLAQSTAAQKGTKTITSPSGASIEISEWDDGARRSKYLVKRVNDPSSRQFWYSQTGSSNSGPNEAGRKTTQQEWCRVRYLYGDDVRIPECWGEFMYSSHLITGLDGMHYELWFSPSSLSYFKIRNQETNVWYAHDGSTNDGRLRTTKEDWCRVIFYHMNGILKAPEECKDLKAKFVNAIAGNSGEAAQKAEMSYVRSLLGKARDPMIGAAAETGFEKLAAGSIKNLDYSRGAGLLKNTGTGKTIGAGLVVGMAVDYGIDKIKDKAGWQAKDANAGMIAAEVVTTTVASTAITTAIMTAAGASFNPVVAGVGLLVAGGIAGGEEIAKASKDTGIQFENMGNPRYNRDLNGIGPDVFAHQNPAGTFDWGECANEGARCTFNGIRSVRYGAGDKFVERAFFNAVDCNNTAFGSDPAPGVAKTCVIQTLPVDRFYLIKQAGNPAVYFQKRAVAADGTTKDSYCTLQNMSIVNAYGLTFREVPTLSLKGTNEDMCAVPNGFYKLDKHPTVYRAYGESLSLASGRVVGTKFCAVPSLEMLNSLGGASSIMTLPPGSDITRFRTDVGVCTMPEK